MCEATFTCSVFKAYNNLDFDSHIYWKESRIQFQDLTFYYIGVLTVYSLFLYTCLNHDD
jgi:hypothetical protein